ncbi:TolC family protein [Brevibacillus agri]|uniref:TolC family protein n=1 Tax=Brevibacillus agri TaxID=51101 RepID=UPI0025B6E5F4|nr:TolC family protein [Brevibacillus agri]MDN4095439.1 TolC family protein [Brevibacillus agri]MED4571531.1 TolC family protein [Brevibacillus agri]
MAQTIFPITFSYFVLTNNAWKYILFMKFDNDNRYHYIFLLFIGGSIMKSRLSKHIYSTTLVAALLAGNAHLALAEEPLVAAAEQTQIVPLSLDHAVEQALKNDVDLELLRLTYDNTRYETLMTLRDKAAIKKDDINTLDEAKKKYEETAKAQKTLLVDEASYNASKISLQMQVQKAYFEARALEEKIKLQKNSIRRQTWAQDSAAKEKLSELENSFKQALTKLNELLNEKRDRQWLLETSKLSYTPLPTLEETKALAYQKRPDMVKAEAERAFAQVKVDYTSEYAAISTYKGRIALNELRKAELLLQKLKQKVDQEVSDAYEKAVAAKKALDESTAAKDEAWKTYHATLTDYANKKVSLNDLIETEAELFDSETKAADSLYQYNIAVSTLNQSVGL